MQRVLILGGYGNVGIRLADLLLEHTSMLVILAARNKIKIEAAVAALSAKHRGNRVDCVVVDASDTKKLMRLLVQVDMVVVASSTMDNDPQIAKAALEANIDYFDLNLSATEKIKGLRKLAPRIQQSGRCFITDCGFHPGIPSAMVRFIANEFSKLEKANVASLIKLNSNNNQITESAARELAEELDDFHPSYFEKKKWKESWSHSIRVDFGKKFGHRRCAPLKLEEMWPLPVLIPSLEETGFYIAGFNWISDFLVLPVSVAAVKVGHAQVFNPIGKLLRWSFDQFARPPYGVMLKLIASGIRNDKPAKITMSLFHEDGYAITAASVASCIIQYLEGKREPGLHFQGLYIEPVTFFSDLGKMGVQFEVEENAGKK
ncbi:MAG: saccharopine dehydrogenase NADP-binding domain-containing protein [Chloroherpetonaceae bacterium]|nr:saccharopine dehydrogenase NADP-binding domain-containing protein [Chloroherpetonaceae bacterium]